MLSSPRAYLTIIFLTEFLDFNIIDILSQTIGMGEVLVIARYLAAVLAPSH